MKTVIEPNDDCHVNGPDFRMIKILVIEDNLNIRENVAELLELGGYKVITAENGSLGVECARNQNPDIILCDVMMPLLNGLQVLEALKEDALTREIPFVFLTSFSEQTEIKKALSNGAAAYLVKPFEEEELFSTLRNCLERSGKNRD